MEGPVLVSIKCTVYNHEPYLRDCLNGFVMQKTNFRFEAIVHDDASTDGSADIIREYAEKYPEIIKPIYETENQYSKHDGSLERIMDKACTGRYIAICEGDDFWTDSLKLQKQVDFLESNQKYSMCCSDAAILTNNNISYWTKYNQSQRIPPKDMILGGGLFVQTATLMYRRDLLEDYPSCCKDCHVGDYPLKIWGALNGGLYYLADNMATYRFLSAGSWTSRMDSLGVKELIPQWQSEIDMLNGLNEYSNYEYSNAFMQREMEYLWEILVRHSSDWREISMHFKIITRRFEAQKRVINFLMCHHLSWMYRRWRKIRYRKK